MKLDFGAVAWGQQPFMVMPARIFPLAIRRRALFRAAFVYAIVITPPLPGMLAADATWTGAANGVWENNANWSPAAFPGKTAAPFNSADTATFSNAVNTAVTLGGANLNVRNLVFDTGAGSFTFNATGSEGFIFTNGGSATIAATVTGTGLTQTLAAPMVLIGNYTFANDSADSATSLVVSGSLTAGTAAGANVLLAGSGNGTNVVSGVISDRTGGGAVAVAVRNSDWRLSSGANTYTGGTAVTRGNLLLGASSAGAPGAVTSGPIGTGAVALGNTTGAANASLLFATGTGGLRVDNAITVQSGSSGILTLGGLNTSGTNTFGGAITLQRNVLLLASSGGTVAFSGAIGESAPGAINKFGGGTVVLSGANTFSGGTTITAGTLRITVDGALGLGDVGVAAAGTLTLASGVTNAINDTATLTLNTNAGNFATLNLNRATAGPQETVRSLVLGGVTMAPGTYGSSTSGAQFVNNNYFSGNGELVVLVPEPGTSALVLLGGLALLVGVQQRRRCKGAPVAHIE